MEDIFVDVAVIGAGPAGQKAAIQSVKLGFRTLIIDKEVAPGGSCLYSGTIPSKSLREAVVDYTRFYERGFREEEQFRKEITIQDLNHRLDVVIDQERSMIERQFRKNHVRFIHEGRAHFKTPQVLLVSSYQGELLYRIKAKNFIICVGSKPRNPPEIPFDGEVIVDSTTLLGIKKIPKTMVVLGGGVIGAEYASMFAALGTRVTIADKKDHILSFLDSEMGVHLQTALTNLGMKFLGNKKPIAIERVGDRGKVTFDDGSEVFGACVLYALGRTANVKSLEIENAGLVLNSQGYISVNNNFQTEQPHIYAVGDVIGGPCLASTSMEQGRLAARHACQAQADNFPKRYPFCVWTIPEISSVGYTEDQLKDLGFRYEVGRAHFYEVARSHITGSFVGLLKILFHKETLEILGVHIIGRTAAELIHIGEIAMDFNAKIDYFVSEIFNYPSYSEAYRIAALNGLNKIEVKRLK
jgi:NAD(P) transhydrogenase